MASKQTLYVDYAGGKFEYWFYSEGRTYRGSRWEYPEIKRWAKTQGFTDIILTNEAKERV